MFRYSGLPSIIRIFWIRVFVISTGKENTEVTNPLNILDTKCAAIPSERYPSCACERNNNRMGWIGKICKTSKSNERKLVRNKKHGFKRTSVLHYDYMHCALAWWKEHNPLPERSTTVFGMTGIRDCETWNGTEARKISIDQLWWRIGRQRMVTCHWGNWRQWSFVHGDRESWIRFNKFSRKLRSGKGQSEPLTWLSGIRD